jgi:hypothetical protein
MRAQTEECPILLLDDILSELDPTRRGYVLGQAGRAGQTIISTTDLTDFPQAFLSEAAMYRVSGGTLSRIEPPAGLTPQPSRHAGEEEPDQIAPLSASERGRG